jgi:predicted nuclease of predicted toxin-antitoxin system
MKIKLDENLPLGLAAALKSLGHNVHTTADEGLAGKSDAEVCPSRSARGDF